MIEVFIGKKLVKSPQLARLRLEQKPENEVFLGLILRGVGQSDAKFVVGIEKLRVQVVEAVAHLHSGAVHRNVVEGEYLGLVGRTKQVFVDKHFVFVLLVCVLVEVGAVEVEQAVRQLVASHRLYAQVGLLLLHVLQGRH